METPGKVTMTVDVGHRLKELREERGISMRSLARASALSANALSMIERGLTSPSVSTLTKIAGALEVPVTAFFRKQPERKPVVFKKASERAEYTYQGGSFDDLGGDEFSGRMEAFLVTLAPGETSGAKGMMHTGSEFVQCTGGTVEYVVDGQAYELHPGDNLFLSGKLHHLWANNGREKCTLMVVICGYDESEQPFEFHLASSERASLEYNDR